MGDDQLICRLDELLVSAREYHASGRLDQAVSLYSESLKLRPNDAETIFLLGLALFQQNRPENAATLLRRAIEIDPEVPEFHCDLGRVLQFLGDCQGAIEASRRAVSLRPQFPEASFNLASSLHALGKLTEAIEVYRSVLSLDPERAEAWNDMGAALHRLQKNQEAIAAFQRALRLRPRFATAMFNLANTLCEIGSVREGLDTYRQTLALQPGYPDALNNLGMSLFGLGRVPEAIECFDEILLSNPGDAAAHSNRIYAMHYDPRFKSEEIHRELCEWNFRHAMPLQGQILVHTNSPDPGRPLRIGYVSGDFRDHVVGWNLLPLFRRHDAAQFRLYCYSNVRIADAVTEKLRSYALIWRDIVGVADEQVAKYIREDGVDILIDLSVHSGGNRLRVFALKPAPIQITYLGYPGSTGLDAIDFRFSAPGLETESDKEMYAEKTHVLPHTYWCYQPGGPTPPVSPLPALSNGHITFGCLNHIAKVSADAVKLWSRVILGIPGSRLIFHAPPDADLATIHEIFRNAGVVPTRVDVVPRRPWREYIESYACVDISLDPLPYGGGITTCDSLYMGVPVITLPGQTCVARSGNSILRAVGFSDLVASSPDEYVQTAVRLSSDIKALASFRQSLRHLIESSPLMDAPRFARDVESSYRAMWCDWCGRQLQK